MKNNRAPHKQLEATAYHEAGHAVLEIYFGGKLKKISIVPGGGAAGRVTRTVNQRLESSDWNHNYAALGRRLPRMIILLAGDVAQRKYRSSSFRSWHPRLDFETVADYAIALCGGDSREADALVKWLCCHTEGVVEKVWHAIQALAVKLLECSEIDGAEATQLIMRELGWTRAPRAY